MAVLMLGVEHSQAQVNGSRDNQEDPALVLELRSEQIFKGRDDGLAEVVDSIDASASVDIQLVSSDTGNKVAIE